ncbi:MAG TPA: tetratricopeptide repeat protein [Gammaproteobacteria bacterium]|nr:tetratricopeptide repeat protein [Gammaproteobacteria bacterium]
MCRLIVPLVVLGMLAPRAAYPGEAEREAAREAVRAHLESGEHERALETALQSVQRTEQESGAEAVELIQPLFDLAKVQDVVGEYGAAEETYDRVISLIESAHGPYDGQLVAPLSGLGDVFLSQERYEEAIEAFQRARHIWHRVDGINTLEQLEVLDQLTEGFIGANELQEANRAQIRSFRISEHHHGPGNLETVPAMRKLADWFLRTGQHPNAIILYQRAVKILEREFGADDPQLVPVLTGLATARGADGYRPGEAEEALERVVGIIEKTPGATLDERVAAYVNLGDWYIRTNEAQAAREMYGKAWNLLDGSEELVLRREELFGQPINLAFPPMPAYVPIPPTPFREIDYRELSERYVDIEFTVRDDGRVSDVKIADADAPLAHTFYVRRRMYEALYRPRLVDGEPVATPMRQRQIIPPAPATY